MIATEQTVIVARGIDRTWEYAHDFGRWASIMPGYQSCEIVDDDTSLWVLKVGVGQMVQTVKVQVEVQQWAGPERVDFTFKLVGDPVTGSGTYLAAANPDGSTAMSLKVEVAGMGPMAQMWEAMGGPVLPKFARGFAEELKARIEAEYPAPKGLAPATTPHASPGLWARLLAAIRRLFHRNARQAGGTNE